MKNLKDADFHNIAKMAPEFLAFLDDVLGSFGPGWRITSDWRSPAANAAASGSSPTSLHLSGRAVDLVLNPWTRESLWKFTAAVFARPSWHGIELELVHGPTDSHLHVGMFGDNRPSRLILSLT